MPLNSIPPTTTLENLRVKQAVALGENGEGTQLWADVGFWGGLVPGNVGRGELRKMWEAGVKGFKGFLCESGVEVCGFQFPEQFCVILSLWLWYAGISTH